MTAKWSEWVPLATRVQTEKRIYVVTAQFGPAPALTDTFEILVVHS